MIVDTYIKKGKWTGWDFYFIEIGRQHNQTQTAAVSYAIRSCVVVFVLFYFLVLLIVKIWPLIQ